MLTLPSSWAAVSADAHRMAGFTKTRIASSGAILTTTTRADTPICGAVSPMACTDMRVSRTSSARAVRAGPNVVTGGARRESLGSGNRTRGRAGMASRFIAAGAGRACRLSEKAGQSATQAVEIG